MYAQDASSCCRKQLAIDEEDYDAAKMIKAEIVQIRTSRRVKGSQAQAIMMSTSLPLTSSESPADAIQSSPGIPQSSFLSIPSLTLLAISLRPRYCLHRVARL